MAMFPPPYDQSYMKMYENPIKGWYFIRRTYLKKRIFFVSEGVYYYSDTQSDSFHAGRNFREASEMFCRYFRIGEKYGKEKTQKTLQP